eukprot:SAG22_NODE_5230_length_1057_cov_1.229645_1_plen_77_part_00
MCNPAVRGEISDIHLDNIQVNGNGMRLLFSQLAGNSTAHGVSGVTIEKFVYDGAAVKTLAGLNATTNEFVTGVKIL